MEVVTRYNDAIKIEIVVRVFQTKPLERLEGKSGDSSLNSS